MTRWTLENLRMPEMKKVVVEITFTMLIDMLKDSTPYNVDFYLNESSHCLATELETLLEEEKQAEPGTCFTCGRATAKYIRDATPEDLDDLTPPSNIVDTVVVSDQKLLCSENAVVTGAL